MSTSDPFLSELTELLQASGIAPTPAFWNTAQHGHEPPGYTSSVRPAVGRVQVFVEEHVGEGLSLTRLAEVAGLSTHHFARVFREETGTTPWSYVRSARLRRARRLLEENERSLAEIALDCGFCDQSHFTRVFKREEGVTPGAYRKNLQEREADLV